MAVHTKFNCAAQAADIIPHQPTRWTTCLELFRLSQPEGVFAIVLFYTASIAFAACFTVPIIHLSAFLGLLNRLLLWLLILWKRFSSWNSIVNAYHSHKMSYFRIRPVPRGVVTIPRRYFIFELHMALDAILLLQFPSPSRIDAMILSTVLFVWPLAKRLPIQSRDSDRIRIWHWLPPMLHYCGRDPTRPG